MHIRQLHGPALVLALLFSASPAVAQRANTNQNQAQKAPDPDTIALVQIVDAAIVAAPTAQAGDTAQGDIALKWDSAHLIRGQNGVYVPFTVTFDPSSVRTSEVGVYIRAVDKAQLPAVVSALTPPPAGSKPAQSTLPKYSWDNVNYMQKPADGRITRAIALPPGDYELFVAVKERSSVPAAVATNPPATPSARNGLLRHALLAS